jgi:hypothetical protein
MTSERRVLEAKLLEVLESLERDHEHVLVGWGVDREWFLSHLTDLRREPTSVAAIFATLHRIGEALEHLCQEGTVVRRRIGGKDRYRLSRRAHRSAEPS